MFGIAAGKRYGPLFSVAVGALMVLVMAPVTAAAASSWQIIDLGAGDSSIAYAVNDRGHVVGTSDGRPFLWRDGQITYLPASGVATDVNNHDEVVGDLFVGGGSHAFLWRDGVLTDLGVLPGGSNSFAKGINDRGDVVGWSATASNNEGLHAFLWRDGVMTDLGAPTWPFERSLATDVNNAGVIVGSSGETAVRWRRGEPQPLLGWPAQAEAVNDRGDVAGIHWGGGSMGSPHGYLWRRGQVTAIEAPAGGLSPSVMVMGLNNRAQVVGYTNQGAFVWQRGNMTLLPKLLASSAAYDINNRGQIVGASATRADGLNLHAVIWTR